MRLTIHNYIQPIREAIPEFTGDLQAWDIAMQTLQDIYQMNKAGSQYGKGTTNQHDDDVKLVEPYMKKISEGTNERKEESQQEQWSFW